VDEIASTPQGEGWTPRPPFSARPLPTPPTAPATTVSVAASFEAPALVSPARTFDDTEPITAPITLPEQPASPVAADGFRVLRHEELSVDEVRQVNIQLTAYYHAIKLLAKESRIEPPEAYVERFYIWKMLFKQLIPAGGLVVALFVISMAAQAFGGVSGWTMLWMFVAVVAYGYFAYRTYFVWANTFLFSEERETGIRRKRHRWLFVTEMNPAVETASIQTKDADRNHFTSYFNLNSWLITLDAPAQKDQFLENLGFVRHGDRLKKTVNDWQQYLKQ